MKKRLFCIVSAVCLMLFGCAAAQNEGALDERARVMLSEMTLEQKIGQVLLVNFRTWKAAGQDSASNMSRLNSEVEGIIQTYHLGNIILFAENAQTTLGCARLTADLQSAAREAGDIPLLIGIDQEGGTVTRLGQGTCLTGNMALGAAGDADYAYQASGVIACELAALGVNCDFAPDSDVNDNKLNPVIGLRSFGSDPEKVAELAKAYLKGLTDGGVIGCAKHFPGHGNTSTDTHTGLAIVNKTKDEWLSVEAVPFKALIADGIDMIMTAHIQYPNLDSTQVLSKSSGKEMYLPATLSRAVLTDLLRGELGFDGVICTDAMDMNAISGNFGETQAVIMALNAGADLICNPTELTCLEDVIKLKALYNAITSAVKTGELPEARLDDAARRVIKLKLKNGIIDRDYPTADEQAENAAQVVGRDEHRAVERRIAEAAVTLCWPENKGIELKEGETVLFCVPYDNEGNSVGFAVNRLIEEGAIPKIKARILFYNKAQNLPSKVKSIIDDCDHVVIISEMYGSTISDPSHWQNKMPRAILNAAKSLNKTDTAVISVGLPYDAANFTDARVYVAYGYAGMTEDDAKSGVIKSKYGPNIPAATAAALGALQCEGKLPVSLY